MAAMCSSRARVVAVCMVVVLLWLAQLGRCQVLEESHEESEEEECLREGEEEFNSEVRVATLQFEEVQIQFLVVVFILIVVLAKMVWHHSFMHRVASNIPESCMLIVVGAHIGGIIIGSFYLDDCNRRNDVPPLLRFSPDLFFLYLLPPIVLEAGYFLDNRAFFENLPTILIYAVVGTIMNAFAIGACLFGLFHAGALLTGTDVNFTISSALLFGTICSAVDPVAVLAVFEEIHINKMLHILVFGESLLNDAVTIVLFQVLGAFANRPFDPSLESSERDITVGDVFVGIAQFVIVVVASIIIGLVVGMLGAFITRFSEHVHVLEPIIVFAMGYLSYLLADMFAFSGIVSLIVCAMIMRHYVEANISRKSHTTIKYSMKVLSNVAEMVIFLFLGYSLYDVTVHNWDTGLVLWTLVLVLLFRPIGVVTLTLIMNFFRVRKIDWKSVFIMSYSGLRGAVAFSLALVRISDEASLEHPESPEEKNELKLRQSMLTAVTVLVLFTVFVQGITIKPIVRRLKVHTAKKQKPTMNTAIHSTALDHITAGMEDILGHIGHHRIRERIRDIDSKYLRKIFERRPEARDEEILQTFKRLQYIDSEAAAEKNLLIKWHEDKSFAQTHISLYSPEPPKESEPAAQDVCDAEEAIPALRDILKSSFASPHESHYSHVLSRHERDAVDDHRFEPVAVQRSIIKSKHDHRRAKKRLRFRSKSALADLGSSLPVVDEDSETDGHSASATAAEESQEQQADTRITVEVELEHRGSECSQKPIILADSMETDV